MPKAPKADSFIPKSRLDALTDGVFAFAMTLLVVNIELPEGFSPKSNDDFIAGLADLSDTFVAYLITFAVLVSFWLARAKPDAEPEAASGAYTWSVMLHLLSVTFLPFSLLAVSRYDFPAATWIYGANMILLALSAGAISVTGAKDASPRLRPDGLVELGILVGSALLSMAMAPFAPGYAMLPYLLNLASPIAARALQSR
jgi:uncharacterized membrane protein